MDRGACWVTIHGVSESDTTEHTHVQTTIKSKRTGRGKYQKMTMCPFQNVPSFLLDVGLKLMRKVKTVK